ncbi:phosphatidylinositol-4-phosphate 5-kinase [Skeletonema marinoi]|uniref:Phosphatidylinositol-4-phosphate 5-kinase n=1 Tax=Skeletonema marinoi TaxID=267567 RepID=A0AAD8Y070_9STRA|nr:phosphatidylinositol-4-phosphate 5-kinase [Skeletonema marinoi]
MVHLPSPDGIASALSLILATLASLRAASRLEQRICNNGSIGLMDGPPILGPKILNRGTNSSTFNGTSLTNGIGSTDGGQVINASPLWEHTEAFRFAAILGLVFDDASLDDDTKSSTFSNVIRNDVLRDDSSTDDDLATAIEAGLCRDTRGGGIAAKRYSETTKRKDDHKSRNAVISISNWFVRELSAPFAAIPAWRRLLRSLRERKEQQNTRKSRWPSLIIEWPRFLLTGKSDNDRFYDPSKLDFDATISSDVRIPCVVDHPTKKKAQSLSLKTVRVKSFAPNTFRDLRNKCFGVSEKEYAKSILNIAENGVRMENEFGEQISRSDDDVTVANLIDTIIHRRRLFRRDGAYMVKTVKKEEAKAFVEMLPKYHRFMSKRVNSQNSLLTRFCGMYSVQSVSEEGGHSSTENEDKWDGGLFSSTRDLSTDIADDERVYVVMNSVFPPQASSFITRRFDLKGSTVGRECSAEEIQTKGANAVLKDLNLKREVQLELEESASDQRKKKQSRYGIHIGSRKKAALLAQLERDVTLLKDCGVLDYSLLVGVADTTLPKRSGGTNQAPSALQHFFRWMDAPMPYYGAGSTKVDGGNLSSIRGTLMGKDVIYYMGVIDFLQPWTVKKDSNEI